MRHFADTVGAIQVFGQVVRIDLLAAEPNRQAEESKAPVMVPAGQLVLPLEGFVRTYAAMGQMVQQLVKAGVLKSAPQAEAAPQPAAIVDESAGGRQRARADAAKK